VTGVQTCALPIWGPIGARRLREAGLLAGAGAEPEGGVAGKAHEVRQAAPGGDSAEAGHPVLDVEGEAGAGHLAVAADVDPGVELSANHGVEVPRNLVAELRAVEVLAPIEPVEQLEDPSVARQAPDVRGQDPVLAGSHAAIVPTDRSRV
jgi:hypothetical protein